MTIFGDGTQTRAFSYIDDVAPMMAEAIDVPGGAEPGVQRRRRSAVFAATSSRRPGRGGDGRAAARRAPRRRGTKCSTRTRRTTRCARVFGERPQTPLEDGLARMAAWVREHGARPSAPFDGIEILKNLPAAWQRAMTAVSRRASDRGSGARRSSGRWWRGTSRRGCRRTPHVLEIGAGYCDWINNVRAARRVAVDIWPELPGSRRRASSRVVLDVVARAPHARRVVVRRRARVERARALRAGRRGVGRGRRRPPCCGRGGRFIIIQPNFRYAWRRYFDDYTHRSIFTDVSLPALLRSHGFRIDRGPAAVPAVLDARRARADHAVAGAAPTCARRSSRWPGRCSSSRRRTDARMYGRKTVSVVFPAYNEEQYIRARGRGFLRRRRRRRDHRRRQQLARPHRGGSAADARARRPRDARRATATRCAAGCARRPAT